MSDTPRSDEVWDAKHAPGELATALYELAQELERELTARKAELARYMMALNK